MYTVSIFDTSKNLIDTYKNIKAINYTNKFMIDISVSGKELLTHKYPTDCDLQLLSDNGNHVIKGSVIGAIEVCKSKE